MSIRGRRRYGVVVDGTVVTAAVVEDGLVTTVESIEGSSPIEALDHWLTKAKPRAQVTVALLSGAGQTAEVELAAGIPGAMVRKSIEDQVKAQFPGDTGPFAVAARVVLDSGRSTVARAAAIPAAVMEGFWRLNHASVRYTLPAMTYTLPGVHLAVGTTAAELHLVTTDGATGVPRLEDSIALAVGGLDPDADGATRRSYADRAAEEIERARESWRRRDYEVGSDSIYITGGAVPVEELHRSLTARGYRPDVDLVTDNLDLAGIQRAVGANRSATLRAVLAVAAAISDAGPVGYLDRPGRALAGVSWKEATEHEDVGRRLRLALPITAVVAAIAVVVAFIPAYLGHRTLGSAESAQAQAQAVKARYGSEIALYDYNHSLAQATSGNAGPSWGAIVPAVVATVPPGVSINTMNLLAQAGRVVVTATATAKDPALVPQWLANLARDHVEGSTAGVTVDQSGNATFTTTFSVPRSFH